MVGHEHQKVVAGGWCCRGHQAPLSSDWLSAVAGTWQVPHLKHQPPFCLPSLRFHDSTSADDSVLTELVFSVCAFI